jgi:pimeloyl-ACP methyl ester carboxylesterase
MRGFVAVTAFLACVCALACKHDVAPGTVRPELPSPASAPAPNVVNAPPAPPAPEPPTPPEPAKVERVPVPKDHEASFVRAEQGALARVVFLPGLCSNAFAYLSAFPEAARAHGGVVAIDGDQPCGARDSGYHSFTWDSALQRERVEAALAASGAEMPADGFTLVGYSAGASIAERMHQKWPEMFPRLVLIAPPDDPSVDRLRTARGVVSMSCAFDVPDRMKKATKRLQAKGVPSFYIEMPGCTHGQVAEGERVFGEAFAWLDGLSER